MPFYSKLSNRSMELRFVEAKSLTNATRYL
jgi:hypothetical protein